MKIKKYLLLLITLSVCLMLSTQNAYASHDIITWNEPVQYNPSAPTGFPLGGQMVFSGRIGVAGCSNHPALSVTMHLQIKNSAGNWQILDTISTTGRGQSTIGYQKTVTIPSTGLNLGLTDLRVDYSSGSGQHTGTVIKTNHVLIGLCPLQGTRASSGSTTLSQNCLVEGTVDLFNRNLTISGASMQINANSTFIFRQGYSITIGSGGYIVKSANATVIRKDPPYQYEYQSEYGSQYEFQGGEGSF